MSWVCVWTYAKRGFFFVLAAVLFVVEFGRNPGSGWTVLMWVVMMLNAIRFSRIPYIKDEVL